MNHQVYTYGLSTYFDALMRAGEAIRPFEGLIQLATLIIVVCFTLILLFLLRQIRKEAHIVNHSMEMAMTHFVTTTDNLIMRTCQVKDPPEDCHSLLIALKQIKRKLDERYESSDEKE